MTSGIGFLNKNGIVLAVDTRSVDEKEATISNTAQKLFQLDRHSGLVIAGGSRDDDLGIPICRTVEQFLDTDVRRDVILHTLVENFCSQFFEKDNGYVHFIFGNLDSNEGYLLLKCCLGVTASPPKVKSQSSHPAEQVIYEVVERFNNSRPRLFARVYVSNERHEGSCLGAIGVEQDPLKVYEYVMLAGGCSHSQLGDLSRRGFVQSLIAPSGNDPAKNCRRFHDDDTLLASWSLEKACQAIETAICKIACDHPLRVNTNIRVATIDREKGFHIVDENDSFLSACA
jgi:20S proteasome alpha/beta subunit